MAKTSKCIITMFYDIVHYKVEEKGATVKSDFLPVLPFNLLLQPDKSPVKVNHTLQHLLKNKCDL